MAVSALCRSALDMRMAINEAVFRRSEKSVFESAKPSGCPTVAEIPITPCEAVQAPGWGEIVRVCEIWLCVGVPGSSGCLTSADGCIGCRCYMLGTSVCETVCCGREWNEDVGYPDADSGRECL